MITTFYEVVADTVMKSGDVSVFWQEIIDSYRDIMVVKNTNKAKEYLDLTELEYETLSKIAASFTMSRLSYHVSILENAMSDMQRAFNSKRSIAEIALTRMCDAKLDTSVEALVARIETLERDISMLKYGVAANPAPKAPQTPAPTVEVSEKPAEVKQAKTNVTSAPYSKWGSVIEKIGEVKRSLAAAVASASVYRVSDTEFSLKLGEFFAKRVSESEQDMAILKGVIAEFESLSASDIKLNIISDSKTSGTPFADIENALR